jgi:hypothetical protein
VRKFSKKQYIAAGAAAVIIAGGAGAAFAYWTTTGSGSGTGSTTAGTVDQLTFTQNTLSAMYPGDSSQDLIVKVTNTSGERAYVSSVKAYVTTDKADCTGADFLLNGEAAPSTAGTAVALGWAAQDLAKNGGNANATSTIQFNDTDANQDACKSATVTINYLAS